MRHRTRPASTREPASRTGCAPGGGISGVPWPGRAALDSRVSGLWGADCPLRVFTPIRRSTGRSEMIASMSVRTLRAMALCAALLLVVAARADGGLSGGLNGGPLDASNLPTVTITAEGAETPWTWTPPVDGFFATPDGYQLRSVYQQAGVLHGRADVKLDLLRFNPDPFVLNNILVTNTTTTTQIFSAFVGFPTTFAAPNLISGTITTSVIDEGSNGATVASVPGTPIYQAQIDGVTVATMQNDPFSLTTTQSTASSATFGPIASAVPVTSNMGIQLRFSLTAGDTAAILSRFDVVPEPSSAAACVGTMLVLSGTFSRRRRRHA